MRQCRNVVDAIEFGPAKAHSLGSCFEWNSLCAGRLSCTVGWELRAQAYWTGCKTGQVIFLRAYKIKPIGPKSFQRE